MGYQYANQRENVFTESGQKMFLSIRDRVNRLIIDAGAVTMGAAISGETGDSWNMMACVDRLVELGEIYELELRHPVRGQNRTFSKH